MTEPRTPRTEAGRWLIGLLDPQQEQIAALIRANGMEAQPIDYRPFVLAIEAEAGAAPPIDRQEADARIRPEVLAERAARRAAPPIDVELREAAQEWADLCHDYDLNERGQAVMARLRAALAGPPSDD